MNHALTLLAQTSGDNGGAVVAGGLLAGLAGIWLIFAIAGVVGVILGIVALIQILGGNEDVSFKLLWSVIVILLWPLLGAILWFVIGRSSRSRA